MTATTCNMPPLSNYYLLTTAAGSNRCTSGAKSASNDQELSLQQSQRITNTLCVNSKNSCLNIGNVTLNFTETLKHFFKANLCRNSSFTNIFKHFSSLLTVLNTFNKLMVFVANSCVNIMTITTVVIVVSVAANKTGNRRCSCNKFTHCSSFFILLHSVSLSTLILGRVRKLLELNLPIFTNAIIFGKMPQSSVR